MVSPGGAETADSVTARRGAPATVRRADARRSIAERPAPQETIVFVVISRLLVPVLTPLPDVAVEIEQTEIVGLEAADRL